MSNAEDESKTYRVSHREREGAPETPAGIIAIDGEHYVKVISAEPKFADLLALAESTLNDSEVLLVKTKPPADAEPMSLYKRQVERTAPDAGDTVIELLRRDYGFVLTPQ
jgi:hypothetical protein